MEDMWIEVFKAGSQTDSAGNTKDWTETDLDTMVNNYNNQPEDTKHEAPVVIGHPVTDSPAYGWVKELKRTGDTLYANLTNLNDKFVEWVKQGLYKKRSISLYEDLMLKHVGFLGGVPPAVKGLADPAFKSDKESVDFEFEDLKATIEKPPVDDSKKKSKKMFHKFSGDTMDPLLNELIQWISDTFGEETANQTAAKIEELKTKHKEAATPPAPAPASEQTVQHSEPDPRILELTNKIAKMELENRMKDNVLYCEDLIRSGVLVPAQKTIVMNVLEMSHKAGTIKFSEGDSTVEKPGTELIRSLIQSFPAQVSFEEQVNQKTSPDVDLTYINEFMSK